MLKNAFRSPHPAIYVYRHNEDVACDFVYSDVTAMFDGSTAADIFFGTSSKVTDVHGINRDNQFANTPEDTIIQRGSPNHLLSDQGQAIISHKVEDILRTFCINKWQSHTNITRTLLNNDTRLLRRLPIVFSTILVHQHTYGYSAYSTYVTYLITRII
jgi:hypothetical protein